ncbi:helix-turn-helix domain-containing protein [Bariatricus massiliensis]|uniref:Helix-turn-helix domain-containing protein n=1 Tax=Bariatricus massiliensis TaxID=1745713 RepID=A0ABS8DLB5_9FIRM|nr:helix-turn-helix transcriptional regulator [Bariatricus massiliensis]MCB7305811.1 helix-turn-helix domain-containing protein [Bariatricus massiliensis]MCB7376436.1 helix-turn-helix domain-containing protein [Bariatricus massiliensis]MCB7388954.1 helix-turn-helix domain-containing protein [Bariatricus massiliensis]MCB7413127.1 helix-turn-helix domain-containing protein [Bariatricus massiliensis]MCQ5255021.1 helix-turn-helix domain-containing protein [Bariatricus massiliensis]
MLGEKLTALRKKQGYSQQELADMISVTRQTISNWECGQGAPALDKALELAQIYKISLDDLAGNNVEIVAREKVKRDNHVLRGLIGKTVRLECSDFDLLLEAGTDLGNSGKVKVLDVNDEWIRIEYTRTKENSLFQKESVINLIEMSAIQGFEIVEEQI